MNSETVFLTHIQKERRRKKGHSRLQCAKSEARRGIAIKQKRISRFDLENFVELF
jgi:hypothetical protein